MKKIIIILALFFLLPFFCYAQVGGKEDEIFQARVIEIIAVQEKPLADGGSITQQHLKLEALDGEYRGQEIEFNGIGEIEVLNKQIYSLGDKVLVAASYDFENKVNFYVVDFVRLNKIWFLAGLFLAVLIIIGHFKGFRSLLALLITFLIIIKYIIPQILSGASPLIATLVGSSLILLAIIYITEGFNSRAHISAICIFISLLMAVLLSSFFVSLLKLSGAASEEVLFLINIDGLNINLQGLLLAGIIIGALGVLDDVVIAQVATVEQIADTNPALGRKEIFNKAYKVGVSHIASMSNTLFLAYAGASLPLLILFVSGNSAFTSFGQALNSELIASEIVRTLAGSIALILSVPIATYFAAWRYSLRH